jgi:alpha-maltose-1-phosphate synthase
MKFILFALNGRGGMLHYTSQYANALSKRAEVYVVLPSYSDTTLFDPSVRLIKIKAPPLILKTVLASINFNQHSKLLKQIKHINPDRIHFMDNHPWYLLYVLILKKYKILVTQHDPQLHSGETISMRGFIINLVNKLLRNKANKVIVHGKNLKEVLLEFGLAEKKIVVVPHGDYSFFTKFSQKNIKSERYTILQFGRIVKYKGVDTLLKAVPLIKKKIPLIRVIIAGEGDFSPYQKYLTKNIISNVKIINHYISDETVAELFQRCSFVVLPYDDATQSGIIPIAYSFKKPVVTTNVGSLPEVVENGITGLIIEPKNSKQLAEAVISMFKRDLKPMGEQGYIKMKKMMDWNQIVNKILSLTL